MFLDNVREESSTEYPEIREIAKGATLVSIDNVAKYYMEDNDQEIWELGRDFPNIAPPWPMIAFEWVPAKIMNSVETGVRPNPELTFIKRYLFLMKTVDLQVEVLKPAEPLQISHAKFRKIAQIGLLASEAYRGKPPTQDQLEDIEQRTDEIWYQISEAQKREFFERADLSDLATIKMQLQRGVRWLAYGYTLIESKTGATRISAAMCHWGITEEGCFIGVDPKCPDVALAFFIRKVSEEDQAILAKGFQSFLHTPFLALSFMHCKNVSVKDNLPEPRTQKYRKSKGKEPLAKYYTLQIDPMKEVLRKEGGSGKTGLKRALHICRGHFATYGADRPLFGRLVGNFFRPMHRRGSIHEGAVIKTYQVNPPNDQG